MLYIGIRGNQANDNWKQHLLVPAILLLLLLIDFIYSVLDIMRAIESSSLLVTFIYVQCTYVTNV